MARSALPCARLYHRLTPPCAPAPPWAIYMGSEPVVDCPWLHTPHVRCCTLPRARRLLHTAQPKRWRAGRLDRADHLFGCVSGSFADVCLRIATTHGTGARGAVDARCLLVRDSAVAHLTRDGYCAGVGAGGGGVAGGLLAGGETVILLPPPSAVSRCFNMDGDGVSAT